MKHLKQGLCSKWKQYILASAGHRLIGIQQRMQSKPLSYLGNPMYLAEIFRLSLLANTSNQKTMRSSGHIPVFHSPFTPVSTDVAFMKAVHIVSRLSLLWSLVPSENATTSTLFFSTFQPTDAHNCHYIHNNIFVNFLLTSLLMFQKYFCELKDYCVHLFVEIVEMKL